MLEYSDADVAVCDELNACDEFTVDNEELLADVEEPVKASVASRYCATEKEFGALDVALGKLCYFAAWQIAKQNCAVQHIEETVHDIRQDCFLALLRSAAYWKRLSFIKSAFRYLESNCSYLSGNAISSYFYTLAVWKQKRHVDDVALEELANNLAEMLQESYDAVDQGFAALAAIHMQTLNNGSQSKLPPSSRDELVIDYEFMCYAKSIIWRTARQCGKKIKQERDQANIICSLSDCEFLDVDADGKYNGILGADQLSAVNRQLAGMRDSRPYQVFNMALEEYHSGRSTFKKSKVRRKTGMAYHTIKKQIGVIREVIEQTGGFAPVSTTYNVPPVIAKKGQEQA